MQMKEFEIMEKEIGPVVEIEESVHVWQMPKTFGRDYEMINNYLVSNAAECTGMPYARYVDMQWQKEVNRGLLANIFAVLFKKWHFFAGLPGSKVVQSSGPLLSRQINSQKYVRALHKGPYKDVGPTYKALYEWSLAQGLALKNEAIECYLNDPAKVKPADIETEILIPISAV
ncbi:MAG: GyrI-like domain-containing protein [Gammaproteobacteria bacterium]|nr:GyrI-like domain-containing protein [Gammaproteobacteria bacterium]